jgi:uncharacterized protein (TIGR03086 family)
MSIDLTPATQRLAALVREVRDDQLLDPTPCPEYTVGDLLDHIGGLPAAFVGAATKQPGDIAPPGNGANLPEGWRVTFPDGLAAMAAAWADPAAWEGMTSVGGVDLPGEACGVVALEEVVVHGWDLARATGQPFEAPDDELAMVAGFYAGFPDEGRSTEPGAGFGPVVPVADNASNLDRVIAASGRNPAWSP